MNRLDGEPGSTLVEDYGSGLRRTEIHLLPDGTFQWTQRSGPACPAPLTAPDPALARAIAACSVPGARWVPATASALSPGALTYLTSSPLSAVSWLELDQTRTNQVLTTALENVGRALRALHQLGVPDSVATSPGPRRIVCWLGETDSSQGNLAKLAELAWPRWGRARLSRLRDWCVAPRRDTVLVHGFASLGTLLPPLATPESEFLIGADLAAGRPESDLGWLLGELYELRWVGIHRGVDFRALGQALRRGYGPGCHEAALGRNAVLRLVTHLHDFAAYAGWTEEFTSYIDFTAELIDDEGRRAVDGGGI
ncbi:MULTISPECIES: phosphotransferase [Amycolatopsis]|uniref:Phosphotransferase n=1 Tax=Amycolatopsis albidoflavus TaxID=102226 RepID=A0ABW5HTK6_9PSEU